MCSGTGMRSRLASLKTTMVAGCAAATVALTSASFGQNTCNPSLSISLSPSATHYAAGQTVTITVTFGTGDINGGTTGSISDLSVLLDCASAGNLCASGCADGTNPYIKYNGDGSITHDLSCGGLHTVTSNNPGGGTGVNPLNFHFTPEIVLPPNSTCQLSFTVTVQSLGALDSKLIRGRATISGLCNNKLDLFGCSTYSYNIVQPEIHIEKDVNPDEVCEGDSVTYTYTVTNTGGVPLAVDKATGIVDDNGNADPSDDFHPTYMSGDTNGNDLLDLDETWIFTYGPVTPAAGVTTNVAVVTGTFTNAVGTVTVTDDDDASVEVFKAPNCSITPTPGTCSVQLCVDTDACSPFTVAWSGPNGYTNTGDCITLDASNAAGLYHAIVTDCHGCTSPDPCEYNFTPPVAPDCTITVGACPFPRLLTVVPTNCSNCTYQWGTGTAGNCTPINGATGTTYNAPSAGNYCVTVTSHCFNLGAGCSNDGCSHTCSVNVPDCQTGQGRTPGFWKQEHHWGHWPFPFCASNDCPCGPATLFCSADAFDCSNACTAAKNYFQGKTLQTVLSTGGGGWAALGRQAASALLNSYHSQIAYPLSPSEVKNLVNQAMQNCTPNAAQTLLAGYNELEGGPLGGNIRCTATVAGAGSVDPDLNKDGVVNGDDMITLMDNWGPNPATGDLNHDGRVNGKDVAIMTWLLANFTY